MEVEFGRDVFASDGEKLGTVEGLVVDAGTKELRRIVVGGGRFGGAGRLVDAGAVARSGPDGVHLDVASAQRSSGR